MIKTEFERALEAVKDVCTVNYSELSADDISKNGMLTKLCKQSMESKQSIKQMKMKIAALIFSMIILVAGISLSIWACLAIANSEQPRSFEWVAFSVIALATAWWLYAGLTDIRDFIKLKKACKLPPRVLHFPDVSIEALASLIRFYTKFDAASEDRTISDIYVIIRPGFRPVLVNACDCVV